MTIQVNEWLDTLRTIPVSSLYAGLVILVYAFGSVLNHKDR